MRHRSERFRLADDFFSQKLLELEQAGFFRRQQGGGGHAGYVGDDRGDVGRGYDCQRLALLGGALGAQRRQLLGKRFSLLLVVQRARELAPVDLVGFFIGQHPERVFYFFYLQKEPVGSLLNLDRRSGFVNQVNGFVGQEAVGEVTLRELRRRGNGVVTDGNLVKRLVAGLDSLEDLDGFFDVGLVDDNRLEPPLERRVRLDVLLVVFEGGGADAADFAAGQRGF